MSTRAVAEVRPEAPKRNAADCNICKPAPVGARVSLRAPKVPRAVACRRPLRPPRARRRPQSSRTLAATDSTGLGGPRRVDRRTRHCRARGRQCPPRRTGSPSQSGRSAGGARRTWRAGCSDHSRFRALAGVSATRRKTLALDDYHSSALRRARRSLCPGESECVPTLSRSARCSSNAAVCARSSGRSHWQGMQERRESRDDGLATNGPWVNRLARSPRLAARPRTVQ
jgi:hypothetical protein